MSLDVPSPSTNGVQSISLSASPPEMGWTGPLETGRPSRWGTLLTFVGGDLVAGLLLYGLVHVAMITVMPAGAWQVYPAFFVLLPVLLLALSLSGLYRWRFFHPALEMPRVAAVTGLVAGTAALTIVLATGQVEPALPVALWAVLGMGIVPLCRTFVRILGAQAAWWGVPALIIAAGQSGDGILRTLQRWPEIGLRPVAVLTDRPAHESSGDHIPYGPYASAPRLAQLHHIPYVLVSHSALAEADRPERLLRYAKFFDHVLVVPDASSIEAVWTTGRSGEGLIGYSMRHASLQPGARFLKRVVDLVGAGMITACLLPVLAAIAATVRWDTEGSALYRQERMGLDGRIFTVLKFRTMHEDAAAQLAHILSTDPVRRREYECYHKMTDDPRITPFGRFLRRYSLDELPQLFNVLRGDMSLVGPRAYMPSELADMDGLDRSVHQVPPGITGLWQVSGRNLVSFRERIDLDIHYAQNWSVWLDVYLLVRTIPTVFSGAGAS